MKFATPQRVRHWAIFTALAPIFAMVPVFALSSTAHAQVSTTPPPTQICNNANNLLVCINRSGGGTGNGTHIIGWHPGDRNNDFQWKQENDLCGGHVSAATDCPFTNTGLDSAYNGDVIVRIYANAYGENKCLVSGNVDSQGFIRSQLNGCNNAGHAFVLTGCGNLSICGGFLHNKVISVGNSNSNPFSPPVCLSWWTAAIGNQLVTNDDCVIDAQSNFQELFFA